MSTRNSGKLLGSQAFGSLVNHHVLDPQYGGQGGYATNLEQFLNNQAHVSRQGIAVVMETPLFFDYMTDPPKWIRIFRAMWETHARSWDGLRAGLTAEFDEHPVGGTEMQEELVDMKRERSTPSLTLIELAGLPFQNFLTIWMEYGMMSPETKYPLVSQFPGFDTSKAYMADSYTATVLFFETDNTGTKVQKAYLCTNMQPKSNGEDTTRRDMTAAGELLTHSIEWTAITQVGLGPRLLAQRMLDQMRRTNANPMTRQAFIQEQNADVAAENDTTSWGATAAAVSENQVA